MTDEEKSVFASKSVGSGKLAADGKSAESCAYHGSKAVGNSTKKQVLLVMNRLPQIMCHQLQ